MFNNSSKTDKVSSYIVFEESRDKFCDKYPRLLVLSINTSPESCESSFVNILKRVDLPSPFGPITPTLSPSFIENVMFFNKSLIP